MRRALTNLGAALLALALAGEASGVRAEEQTTPGAAAPDRMGAEQAEPEQAASPEVARAVARDPALEARATRLASELRCPVCQGLSIQDSPSPLALQMKDLIRTQVGQGETDAEIRGYFVSKYGEWVLLQPRASGFNLLVYFLPVWTGLPLDADKELPGGLLFEKAVSWTTSYSDSLGFDSDEGYYGTFRLGDLNGDGRQEIVVFGERIVFVYHRRPVGVGGASRAAPARGGRLRLLPRRRAGGGRAAVLPPLRGGAPPRVLGRSRRLRHIRLPAGAGDET